MDAFAVNRLQTEALADCDGCGGIPARSWTCCDCCESGVDGAACEVGLDSSILVVGDRAESRVGRDAEVWAEGDVEAV